MKRSIAFGRVDGSDVDETVSSRAPALAPRGRISIGSGSGSACERRCVKRVMLVAEAPAS